MLCFGQKSLFTLRTSLAGLTAACVGLLAATVLVRQEGEYGAALAERAKRKAQAATAAPPSIAYGSDKLPTPVAEMREAILTAVRDGRIEELRVAIELNEIKPDFGAAASGDPIAYLKAVSGDGEGREILAILGELLEGGYTVIPMGKDIENNKLYVWPYFAEVPLKDLTPAQDVELLRLVSPAAAKDMKDKGRYTHWRMTVGADGTWHSFVRW
ncbi:MAG: hypothetical protein ACREC6_05030 [Hyphomicrobiaceae bacterium]